VAWLFATLVFGLVSFSVRHMKASTLPQSPEQLLCALLTIFPQYHAPCVGGSDQDTLSYHAILIDFTCFFGAELASLSDVQLRSFGTLVNDAIMQPGLLENAFGTCLLEHLHQIKAERRFRPFLSKMAREKTHA
jgi:hypothetical protein